MVKWRLKDILDVAERVLGESNVVWDLATTTVRESAPHIGIMGKERLPRFLGLKTLNYDVVPLPLINKPKEVDIKIELHEAVRSGTHLDLRFKIGNRIYDFAIVKTDRLPTKTGTVQRIVTRNNHSLPYFNRASWEFPKGQYGYGKFNTAYKGKADVLYADKEKIEFEILEGEFKGRYCLRTKFSSVMPDTIIRMKEDDLPYKERRQFTDSQSQLNKALAEQKDYTAEVKVDGSNTTLIPGPKVNVLMSRRLSVVDGKPINRANNLPLLKYHKFPKELWGKRIYLEVVTEDYDVNKTSATLNSNPNNARNMQLQGKRLIAIVWDIESDKPYEDRREDYKALVRSLPRIDNRFFGDIKDQFFFRRNTNPRMIYYPLNNEDLNMTIDEFDSFVKYVGGEGTVIKRQDGKFDDNSEPWIKSKRSETFDYPIVDFKEGTGKFEGSLGALIVEAENGKRVSIGSGFTDEERNTIWNSQNELLGQMVEVKGLERSSQGGIRAPRFIRIHPDK